ncbi:MAG TPA: hypothetical protein VK656_02900 [Candidatus Acidoferrum sp.]|nr:hypothetical protein [Candidatus Acidoferrum sp.]
MPTLDRRVIRLASLPLAALLMVGACGSSSTPAPGTPVPGTTPTPAGPGGPGTPAPTDNGTGGSGAIPSFSLNQDPALEAKLPSQLCGGDVNKESFSGATGAAASANPMLGAFGALGAGGNAGIAIAESKTPDTCKVSAFAYQVVGANSQVFSAVLAGIAAGGSQVSLGGKNVTKIPGGDTATYFYVNNDTIFGVSGATDDQAGQVLSQLP